MMGKFEGSGAVLHSVFQLAFTHSLNASVSLNVSYSTMASLAINDISLLFCHRFELSEDYIFAAQ